MKRLLIIFLLVTVELGESSFATIELYPSKECEEVPPFSQEALKQYILEQGILHPEIVYAQAVLETGRFTSRIFLENNNLFGMRLAKKRYTLAIGERYAHAVYNNWQESVDDYLLWQRQWKRPIETEAQYLRLLDKVYAEDPHYIKVVLLVREKQTLDI